MRIGFLFNDKGFEQKDLTAPREGNNGIGGTQYCFLLLAGEAAARGHEPVFYLFEDRQLPEGVCAVRVENWIEAVRRAKKDRIDVLIFKADPNGELLEEMEKSGLKCIAWAHNFLGAEELMRLNRSACIKRVVFVSREQYDRYIDHPICKKSVFIYNMFDSRRFRARPFPQTPVVTYTGTLGYPKGFHILASVWKDVLKEVPDAQLYVIGSSSVYNKDIRRGPLGVASEAYEKLFVPMLTENGKLLSSVRFYGVVGKEKADIYAQTTVGVMNPSGRTETFGISAVEMEACGIPVVTRAKDGLLETGIDGKTGYLIRNRRALKRRIVQLLKDRERNEKLARQAKAFADANFQPDEIAEEWIALLGSVMRDEPAVYLAPERNWTNSFKWLRLIVRKAQGAGLSVPSVSEMEFALQKLKKCLKK